MNLNYQIIIEVVITILVILTQFLYYIKTKSKIKELIRIFPVTEFDDKNIGLFHNGQEEVEIIEIEDNEHSEVFTDMINSINDYLVKNKGAIDFSIIKSIVERNLESREEEVSANISLPLYIGLMGTFLGIIVGLVKIAFFGGVIQENIDSFIGGVFIAMIASFLGLLLTVVNNSGNFKKSKTIIDHRKNDFYNFLQIELLPHLGNNIYDVFNRFKDNIGEFNRKFSENIGKFDEKFSGNIDNLKEAVESISDNIDPIIENIQTQKEFLKELRGRGYDKIVAANLKTFEIMEKAVPNFLVFIEKQNELNESIGKTANIVAVIDSVMNRVTRFEQSINALGDRIDNADYMGSDLLQKVNKKLEELDNQFELLKQHSQHNRGTIEYHFEQETSKVKNLSEKVLSELQEALNFNIDSNPLLKLTILEDIDNRLREIASKPTGETELKNIANNLSLAQENIKQIKESVYNGVDELISKKKKKSQIQNDLQIGERKNGTSIWSKLNPFRRKSIKSGKR